jgi:hypothetical protein
MEPEPVLVRKSQTVDAKNIYSRYRIKKSANIVFVSERQAPVQEETFARPATRFYLLITQAESTCILLGRRCAQRPCVYMHLRLELYLSHHKQGRSRKERAREETLSLSRIINGVLNFPLSERRSPTTSAV